MAELKEFPCTMCGACCHLVWANKYFRDRNMVREDGACIHLTPDNLCGIQDTRPEVCRFNVLYVASGLVNIVPIELFHDRTIDSTCKYAIHIMGITDPEALPKKTYPNVWEMGARMDAHLVSLGVDYNPYKYPRPEKGPQSTAEGYMRFSGGPFGPGPGPVPVIEETPEEK